MASAISKTTIESNAYNNIFEVIDTRSNVADPRDSEGKKLRTFLYDADPFALSLGFSDYPYIVLEFPSIVQSKETVDGKHKNVKWRHTIIIRTARKGSGCSGTADTGRTDLFSISDDLIETFNKVSVRQPLLINGLKLINLDKVSSDTPNIDTVPLYEAVYELTYEQRMKVSD